MIEALKQEFSFIGGIGLKADDDSWEKAARGIANKMGVHTITISFTAEGRRYEIVGTFRETIDPSAN